MQKERFLVPKPGSQTPLSSSDCFKIILIKSEKKKKKENHDLTVVNNEVKMGYEYNKN